MGAEKIKSNAGLCKVAVVVLGVVVMGVGLHSHFNSSWNGGKVKVNGIESPEGAKLYKICDLKDEADDLIVDLPIDLKTDFKCPKIAMEQYFVSMVIICFILSIINLVATALLDGSKMFRLIDMLYHGVAAVLLLIGAALYITSAVQINDIGIKDVDSFFIKVEFKFLFAEKLAAGGLAILLSVFYAITAFMVSKG